MSHVRSKLTKYVGQRVDLVVRIQPNFETVDLDWLKVLPDGRFQVGPVVTFQDTEVHSLCLHKGRLIIEVKKY